MQQFVSRRRLVLTGVLFLASGTFAGARDGEGTRRFQKQRRSSDRRKSKFPDFGEPWDNDYDRDWGRYDDPYYGEDEYDPALLPPPEADFDYPIEPVDPAMIEPRFRRQIVEFDAFVKPGTIIVDPTAHYLFQARGNRQATRYGVGVGRDGFAWSGKAEIRMKRRWPRWVPA